MRLTVPEPYRLLFPLGVSFAVLAALVWPLYLVGWVAYPATLHWTLMVQGFLHCFVLGFLLTALPAFLHAQKTSSVETALVCAAMLAFGACALAGAAAASQGAYLATLLILAVVAARRLPHRRGDPPEEFVFVALGFLLGIAGGVFNLGAAAGWWVEPAPRYGIHLLVKGMMLPIVLGVGGLLVPTFSAMRDPLVIPGIAKPGQRGPRRALYLPLALLFLAAVLLDAAGRDVAAAWLRVIAGSVLGSLVWKVTRKPGRRDPLSWTIWTAGWMLLLGLWLAALVPSRAVTAFHIAFLGGFGLLTLGIATRVVVTHGGYPPSDERRVLNPGVVAAVVLALTLRVLSDLVPSGAARFYAASGTCWILGWGAWCWNAIPRIARRAGKPILPADHPQRILLRQR